MSFGHNLQFFRKMNNSMTQERLAEKLGVSRQTISKWEMDYAFPEMDKAIILCELFNCSLDDLFRNNINSNNNAYSNIRVETVKEFRYVQYAIISGSPEDDAKDHITKWANGIGITDPTIIGWDFPFLSQEQINVFHMHGYCVACILPDGYCKENKEAISQAEQQYAVITIENPFTNPFDIIPNAYKTLQRYIEVNGYRGKEDKDVLWCFEKEYSNCGVEYMDVYIAIE